MPASAEGRRSATSPVPSTRESAQTITYHSGGVFSVCTTERSVAHRLGCSTCTGVNASSYQKLCRSSVDRRRAAARIVSAASGHHAGRDRVPLLLHSASSAGPRRTACSLRSRAAPGLPGLVCGSRRGWAHAGGGRPEAAVAALGQVFFGVRRQIPAAAHRAPAVDDGPPDHKADLDPRLSGRRGACCRRRRRSCCVRRTPSARSSGCDSRGRSSCARCADRRSGDG